MSSSAPYLCSRELLSSSGVLCSTFFKSSNFDYLLTLTANRINIYSVHLSPKSHHSNENKYYLVHRLSNQLFGKPQDIYPITVSSSRSSSSSPTSSSHSIHQHLLVTFDSGKLIVLNYNHKWNQIDVVKLYNAEIGALGDNAIDHHHDSLGRNVYPGVGDCPFISYDNVNEISAVTLYSYKVLFISHKMNQYTSTLMANCNLKPFVMDLATLNLSGAIIDICFLTGYSRPTLAVLQDIGALPIGHAYQVRHTCCVTVLAVDMITESCVVLWKQDELPHDSFKLVKPGDGVSLGGVIVVSMNAILVVSQESVHGLATNSFAKVTVSEHIPLVPWPLRPGIELHTCRWVDITPPPDPNSSQASLTSSYLVSLRNGMLFLIRMEAFGGETICGGNIHFYVELVAQSVHASCMSVLHLQQIDSPAISVDSNTSINNSTYTSLLLLASTVTDCLLLHTTLTVTTESITNLNPIKTGVRLFSQSVSNDLSDNNIITNLGIGNSLNNPPVSSIYSTPTAGGTVKRQRKGSWQSSTATMTTMTPNGESKSIENGSDSHYFQLAKKEEDWLYAPPATAAAATTVTDSDDPVVVSSNEVDAGTGGRGSSTGYKPPVYLLHPNDLLTNETEISSASTAAAGSGSGSSSSSAPQLSRSSELIIKKKLVRMNFHLHDSLVVVGPILSGDVVSYEDAYNLGYTSVAWTRDDILQRNRHFPVVGGSSGVGIGATTSANNIAAYIVDREQKEVLQFCCGLNSESSLLKVTQGKRMSKIAARNFFDISSLCSLYSKPSQCSFLFLSREGGGSVQYLAQGMGRSANLASREGNTRVIQVHEKTFNPQTTSGGLKSNSTSKASSSSNELHFYELIPETSCFIHDQRTISIGYVLEMKEKSICVQACSKGLRVIQISVCHEENEMKNNTVTITEEESSQGNPSSSHPSPPIPPPHPTPHHPSERMTMTALHDCLLEEDIELGGMGGLDSNERILYVDYSSVGGWVTVLSTFGIVYLLQYQPNDESLELKYKFISNDLQAYSPTTQLNHHDIPQHCKLISVSLFTGYLPLNYSHDDHDYDHGHQRQQEKEEEKYDGQERKGEESKVSPLPSSSLLEEELLYGTGEGIRNEKDFYRAKSANFSGGGIGNESADKKTTRDQTKLGVYLVIVDRMGSVSIVQISSWTKHQSEEIPMTPPQKLFQTPPLGSLPNFIHVTPIPASPDPSPSPDQSSFPVPPKRFTTEARLCVLGKNDNFGKPGGATTTRPEELKLCLITTLNTGDVLIYTAVEDRLPPHSISLFVKLDHSYGTRRRRAARSNAEKLRKAARGESVTTSSSLPATADYLGLGYTVFQSMISISFDSNKGTIVTISGVHPLILSNEKGLPHVQSLGLPELPYAGSGIYLLTSFYYGTISGLAVLWREEKLDLNDPSQLMLSGGLRAVSTLSTLGLYQDIPDLISISYSNTSLTRQTVGYTTHKIIEFNENKTEDLTQKALLKSKTTSLLNCSQIHEKNFDHNIFTSDEIAKEEGLYDRFFPDLTSFYNPMNTHDTTSSSSTSSLSSSSSLSPPPKLYEVEYRLSIMQNGVIVDNYLLPKGEKILDMTILSLTVRDKSVPPPPLPPHGMEDPMKPPLIGKKRVFIAACTGIDDKHGEDTQGEGRLLFFALDYAMYQDDEIQLQQQEQEVSGNSSGGGGEMKDIDGNQQPPPPPVPPLPHHPRHMSHQHLQDRQRGISAAQKKFYGSIKPKLRLLWAGPGPGTVVTQFKEEYVLCTVGPSIYIYQLNQETMELEQIAFIFAQVSLLLPPFLPPPLTLSSPPHLLVSFTSLP
jgi:hypothetical protein